MRKNIFIIIASILLAGCAPQIETTSTPAPPPSLVPATLAPTSTASSSPTRRPTITLAPTATTVPLINLPYYGSPAPIKINIYTPDGTTLRGYFYPAARKNAPVVVLMHQFKGNQTMWNSEDSGFIPWLQNWPPADGSQPTPSANGQLAASNPALTFNVLTFDFRGHGESDGEQSEDFSIYLIDARAAYEAARTMPDVDPTRIVGIGTSIGADAVINACDQDYCRGAFAISAGSWLGIDFTESVSALISQKKPVRCMYADNDAPTPQTCWSVSPGPYYKIFGYPGLKHGMTFFTPRKMEDRLRQKHHRISI
jgi:dienelactone hydrolase